MTRTVDGIRKYFAAMSDRHELPNSHAADVRTLLAALDEADARASLAEAMQRQSESAAAGWRRTYNSVIALAAQAQAMTSHVSELLRPAYDLHMHRVNTEVPTRIVVDGTTFEQVAALNKETP